MTHTALIVNVKADHIQGQNKIHHDIQKKVGALEARLDGRITEMNRPTTASLPTWSSVAKGDHLPAKVEVRMEEMEGAEKETSEERLRKIRKTIPDAKAIIPHLRAFNNVSVIVRDERRRDQIIQARLQEAKGIKLIRRPYLIMASVKLPGQSK